MTSLYYQVEYIAMYIFINCSCNTYIVPQHDDWKKRVVTYLIDYNTLKIDKAIAHGLCMPYMLYNQRS